MRTLMINSFFPEILGKIKYGIIFVLFMGLIPARKKMILILPGQYQNQTGKC